MRVDSASYGLLFYGDGNNFECKTELKKTSVCICPRGYNDFECSTPLYKKCFLNITEPAFHKKCEKTEDTPYYLYSVPGYDPCYYLNFTRSHEITFYVQCKIIEQDGLESANSETSGFHYKDVIEQPTI